MTGAALKPSKTLTPRRGYIRISRFNAGVVTQVQTDGAGILRLQVLVALVAGIASLILMDASTAQATLFGAGIALLNTLIMVWRVRRATRHPRLDAHRELRSFFVSGLERFVVVALLLAAAMGPLQLNALGVLGGFVVGQLTWLLYAVTKK